MDIFELIGHTTNILNKEENCFACLAEHLFSEKPRTIEPLPLVTPLTCLEQRPGFNTMNSLQACVRKLVDTVMYHLLPLYKSNLLFFIRFFNSKLELSITRVLNKFQETLVFTSG